MMQLARDWRGAVVEVTMGARQLAFALVITAAFAISGCVTPDSIPTTPDTDDVAAATPGGDLDTSGISETHLAFLMPGAPEVDADVYPGGDELDPEEPAEEEPPAEEEDPVEEEEEEPPLEEEEEEEPSDGIPEETEEDPDEPPVEEEEPEPVGCLDDPHEDNDVIGDAGGLLTGWYGAMRACDPDWYTFDLQVGDLFSIELTADEPEGELQVSVYDPAGNLFTTGGTATGDPDFEIEADANGTWYVLVDLVADVGVDLGADYSMLVGFEELICPSDSFEPNNSDLAPWRVLPGSINLQGCPSDEDWFTVWVEPGEELSIEIVFDETEGDLDLTVYDPALVLAGASQTPGSPVEEVTLTAAMLGAYWVQIEPRADEGVDPGVEYERNVSIY